MSLEIHQTDYSIKQKPVIPKYRLSRLFQQTGGQQATISGSNAESIFELPTRCYNLHRSSLNFTAEIPGVAAKYSWVYADVIAPIRQIQLYTRGGVYLMDINNVDKMSSITLKAETNKKNAEQSDVPAAATVSTSTESFGRVFYNQGVEITATPGTQALPTNVPAAADQYTFQTTVITDVTYRDVSNLRYDGTETPDKPQYLRRAFTIGAVNNKLNFEIPLSLFKDSIAELDKDFYFNEVLLLKITWNANASWGFTTDDIDATGTPADITTNIALSELSLFLALEQNQDICSGLIAAVQSGQMNTLIPYTYQFKNSFNTGNVSQNVSIRLNRAHGMYVKRIYHAIFNGTESNITRYNHENAYTLAAPTDGVASYYTAIDNDRQHEFDVRTAYNEDWLVIKEYIKESLVDNRDTYRYKWFVLDKFDDDDCEIKQSCVASGLPLDYERKWDFMGTMGTNGPASNHYSFVVVVRSLHIGPQGIVVQ